MPSRPLVIGVSTKMYLGYARSLAWLDGVRRELLSRQLDGVETFVAPSFPLLESAARILDETGCRIAAQNCAGFVGMDRAGGAATGEVPAGMLAELGVRIVEIGHAERRALFGETDEVVAAKTRAALAAGLTPLLCIGETAHGSPEEAAAVCLAQADATLGDADPASVLFAYEPVWAIGAADPADPAHVGDVLVRIRTRLARRSSGAVRIIYGGSARPGLLPRLPEADGLFLGRFAHDPVNFGAVLDDALAA
ncbi:triose-phosphate isomerase family protein [Microbacterium sp. G2-8]|uniref:triose-phosphate isomerase family protein n=1 Tax=Microbacterium sp. G2-8 TaxID=2842454 RepID=UPI001C88F82E|nr:triose-phosphate isomerase family protein [Microbacterium sp. G2-8]